MSFKTSIKISNASFSDFLLICHFLEIIGNSIVPEPCRQESALFLNKWNQGREFEFCNSPAGTVINPSSRVISSLKHSETTNLSYFAKRLKNLNRCNFQELLCRSKKRPQKSQTKQKASFSNVFVPKSTDNILHLSCSYNSFLNKLFATFSIFVH